MLFDALARDPNNSMARFAIGNLRRAKNRLEEAHAELEAAAALDRNNAWGLQLLGGVLNWLGRPQAAISYIETAIRLNLRDPNIGVFYWTLAHSQVLLDHVDEAIDVFRKAIAANPRLWSIHLYLAAALGLRGDLDEARAELSQSLRLKPDINSLAAQRAVFPFVTGPDYLALADKTINLGLRRAGFPDE